ncbi:DUF4328 domain-containing protein [Streptomyces sp. NPDC020875]|uniref:DUF4328 domain-containing protein n=1 Tax=Streptomyces sp. NPDC020875 TaxID=3154898 RepID=UPI0033CA90BA
MTPCSICRRNPAATAQGLCQQCAASATAVGAPGPVPGPGPVPPPGPASPPAPGYGYAPMPQYASAPRAYGGPTRQVKAPVGLSYAVIVLLCLTIVAKLFAIGAAMNVSNVAKDIKDAPPFGVTRDEADDADRLIALSISFEMTVLLVTGVLFIIWFAVARANASAFAPDITRWGRGWAIGGWLIPFVNLVIPRLVAGTIWEASRFNPYGPKDQQPPTLLTAWWTVWVVSTVVELGANQNYIKAETPDELITAANAMMFGSVTAIAAAVLAILVVRRVTVMQKEKVAGGGQPILPSLPVMR